MAVGDFGLAIDRVRVRSHVVPISRSLLIRGGLNSYPGGFYIGVHG